jgi:ABC-2 type transport system ATP-binding protein
VRVEVRGLTKRFGRLAALRDVSFSLPPGHRVALIGPNGSGKSTLMRVLMGLLRFEGTVLLDGHSPHENSAAARRLAYVPQIAPSLAVPVRELVRALATLRGMSVDGIEKIAARLGLDLDAVALLPFRSLSGGMKQKLLIAVALASDASLLVLDEPTGSLDVGSREHFFALCADRPRETSIVLCSHRLEEVRQLVDRVLVLDEGRLAYDGPAEGFLQSSTSALLEVRAASEAAVRWLEARGFRRGSGNWWQRTVTHAEKLRLLPELTRELGDAVDDLNVRDLETLTVESAEDNGGA